ncbi:hypothetical protein [Streptomyces sp. NRRL S-87]|uniref:hypothetical protein n=1 Tax=Streptomyces sp. NRRL S-87 TaxID=1463920 RepID=UPI00055ACF51|nr:hypothetical protein [Streptomyces sp. NRRL S-87]
MNASNSPGPGPESELDLRGLLQGAVEGLEPADGALDRLRVAVPRRRARKRQALVGAAAALLVGAVLPAFFRVAQTPDDSGVDHSAMAGHGEKTRTGPGSGTTDPDLTGPGVHGPSVWPTTRASNGKGKGSKHHTGKGHGTGPGSSGGSDGGSGDGGEGSGGLGVDPNRPASVPPGTPACQADQLGVAVEDARTPDADGKVYGTFRITNVSQNKCVVGGGGSVSAVGAGQKALTVLDHTAGDAAPGLPDPSQEIAQLMLRPNDGYEVRFAWVPAQACPTPDPTPGASPSGGTTDGGTDGSTDPDPLEDGATPSDGDVDAGPDTTAAEPGSVQVTHVAEPGAPVASATIPNACSGTVYRTGILPAPPAFE